MASKRKHSGVSRFFVDEAEMSGSDHEDDYMEDEENEDDRRFIDGDGLRDTDDEEIQAEVKFAIMEGSIEALHEFFHLSDPVSEDLANTISAMIKKNCPTPADIKNYLNVGPGDGPSIQTGAAGAAGGGFGDTPARLPVLARLAGGDPVSSAAAPGLASGSTGSTGRGSRCRCCLCEFAIGS